MNATAQSYTTREQQALNIFQRHVAAFTSGDLDAVLNDFGEHSVVVTPDGVFAVATMAVKLTGAPPVPGKNTNSRPAGEAAGGG